MILDLSKPGTTSLPEYDICIIGSGPAGITVANELRDTGLRISVLESGKLKRTVIGDQLRKVQSEGIHIRDHSRERILGGASTSWSGLSSPMDNIDMNPRPYLKQSGWPIERSELLHYYEQASQRYHFPTADYFVANGMSTIKKIGDVKLIWEKLDGKVFMSASMPRDFGQTFRHIFKRKNIDLYLDATLIRLEGEEQNGTITRGVMRTSKGDTFEIKAATFVLATGGIENARILLNSKCSCGEGLGNEGDQVGRYMMSHPKNYHGIIKLHRPIKELPYYFGCLFEGYAGYAGLKLKEEIQREKGLLNSYVRFEPLFPWHRNEGVKALIYLMKRCKPVMAAWMKSNKDKVVSLRDYSETGDDADMLLKRKSLRGWLGLFRKLLTNLPQVTQYAYARLVDGSEPKIRTIRLRNFMEMEPDPENRVVLGDQTDIYGQPIPIVRHSCSSLDKESLITLHEILSEELTRNGLGQLHTSLTKEEIWPIQLDSSHHIGTTRMGDNPETSVVNPDCQIHTVPNVYLAGSSVFPTSGCANPTYTIVALSIRLADHLAKQKESRPVKL